MPMNQADLLRLARQLGETELASIRACNEHERLMKRCDELRDAIFANLAGVGTTEEREKVLVGLLAQAAIPLKIGAGTKKPLRAPKPDAVAK